MVIVWLGLVPKKLLFVIILSMSCYKKGTLSSLIDIFFLPLSLELFLYIVYPDIIFCPTEFEFWLKWRSALLESIALELKDWIKKVLFNS